MKKTKFLKIVTILVVLSMLIVGCKQNSAKPGMGNKPKGMNGSKPSGMAEMSKSSITVSEGKGYPVTVTDKLGNSITFENKPEKIAAVSGTFLGLLYDLGGESICTTDYRGGAPVPVDKIKDLPVVGAVYNPDLESIIGLSPNLVMSQFGLQNRLAKSLKESKIPTLTFHMRTYTDVLDHIKAFGRILNTSEKATEIVNKMEQDKKTITDKLPEEGKKVVIIYATSKDISVKLNNSIAGNVADILKLKNIASGCTPEGMGGETTPFSIEYIIEKDPDVILVTSMLPSENQATQIINEKFSNDPLWSGLRAVKEGNIVYLPQKYFLYNPGTSFVDGIEYMAKGVYPEIFGELE